MNFFESKLSVSAALGLDFNQARTRATITGRGHANSGPIYCAALVALSATSASATMRISEDRGGQIGQYLQAFASVRSSGEKVVVDGNCLSACTLVLGLVPRERICATDRARFGFHAAWMPD